SMSIDCALRRFRFGALVIGDGPYHFKNCLFQPLESGISLSPNTNGAIVRSQTNAVVEDCRFAALTSAGIDAFTGSLGSNTLRVVARDSLFNRSATAIRSNASTGGSIQVDLERCEMTNGSEGVVSAFAGSTVRVSNSTSTGNITGLLPASGGLLLTRRNNTVENNTTDGAFTGVYMAK